MSYTNEQFESFSDNFQSRLDKNNISLISEDCIRYDFFNALTLSGTKTADCILEYPHPHLSFKGREIDFVHTHKGNYLAAIEMKYFKRLPSNKQDRTGYMAKFMVDLLKLHYLTLGDVDKYFILATDNVMKIYLNNIKNGFSSLLSTAIDEELTISPSSKNGKLKHFKNVLFKDVYRSLNPFNENIKLTRIFEKDFTDEHSIYVFKIHS